MASDHQMTGGLADTEGRIVEIGTVGPDVHITCITGTGELYLDAAKQEEFAQLYVAACHQAKANAAAAISETGT